MLSKNDDVKRSFGILFWLAVGAIYVVAGILQSHLLLHQDVLSFVHWAERLLAGGSYTHDYFETNPPLIFYLSIPPLLITKYFPLTLMMSVRLYVVLLISLSLLLCGYLAKRIFSTHDALLAQGFLLVLAVIFLWIPLPAFGQREHLLVILSMPYTLLMVMRVNRQSVSPWLAASVGVMAGLAFSLKPFFLIVPVLLEGYYAFHLRRIRSILRPELIAIVSVVVGYVGLIAWRHTDYLTMMLPFLHRYYYASVGQSWMAVAKSPFALIAGVAFVYFMFLYDTIKNRTLTVVLALELIGLFVAFVCGGTAWYYHVLPVYMLGLLLFAFLFMEQCRRTAISKTDYVCQGAYAFTLVVCLMDIFNRPYFIQNQQIAWLFLYLASFYFLTLAGMYVAVGKSSCGRWMLIPTGVLSLLFLLIPLQLQCGLYHESAALKKNSNELSAYLAQQTQGQSIYFITTNSVTIYPNLDRLSIASASRFPFLWMMPGLLAVAHEPGAHPQLERDKQFVAEMISEDLETKKPGIVLVDCSQEKAGMENEVIDYLRYFKKYISFQAAWKHYHYVATIQLSGVEHYRPAITYRVYKRS